MNAAIQIPQTFTPEEQLDRRGWIGGSDAAAAIGLNKYLSAFDLWQEKVGLVPPFQGNEATKWGKLHEPVVRQEVAEKIGCAIHLPEVTVHNPAYPYAGCHPDGVTKDGRLYEGKTARYGDGFGEEGSDEIPQHYLIQCQHNMGVCDLPETVLGVLIGGSELRIFNVPADKEMQRLIFEAEARFWNYVTTNTYPAFDATREDALDVIKRMYPGTDGTTIEVDDKLNSTYLALESQKLIEKNAGALVKQLKAELLAAMGNSTYLMLRDGKRYRRAIINKDAYQVRAQSYIDFRIVK